ncbi:peroxisomal biogenesis factor 11-domain-containing protein [Gilbertella persicaria]|uniref:peroxisomal biogenesis factor 11-domain-containing protein n=1 Tax=Gilbertella persicaria TaxID=101096 RepID=UPI002220D226|nr:peroxisomal biogenesis factor 11-domain-containing protein [Gilbertella persicaria]KAI8087662.1 peroxisomal biogenesis factor 11-domain-containing protein [Gilbertella persicaria]
MTTTAIKSQQQQHIQCYALPTPSPPPEPIVLYHEKKTSKTPWTTRWLNVLQRLLKELDGRDKMMKVIQYFIKILLHYKVVKAKHWSTLTSHFSMTRKILRLGTALGPLREIQLKHDSVWNTLILSNEIVNAVSDDVFCLYKLGFFGSKVGDRSEILSAYCWFLGIMVDIRSAAQSYIKLTNAVKKHDGDEKSLLEHQKKIFVMEVSIVKLLMDGVFCACDILQPSYSSSVQAWSGFFSGALAGYKLCIKFSN